MKKVKYYIEEGECIGLLPDCITIDVFLLFDGYGEGLLYFPPKITYFDEEGNECVEKGCGSFSFAIYDKILKCWLKSNHDFFNISKSKDIKIIENLIKRNIK